MRPPTNCFLALAFLEPCQKSMLFLILQVISDVLGNMSTSNVAKTIATQWSTVRPFFLGRAAVIGLVKLDDEGTVAHPQPRVAKRWRSIDIATGEFITRHLLASWHIHLQISTVIYRYLVTIALWLIKQQAKPGRHLLGSLVVH